MRFQIRGIICVRIRMQLRRTNVQLRSWWVDGSTNCWFARVNPAKQFLPSTHNILVLQEAPQQQEARTKAHLVVGQADVVVALQLGARL